MKQALMNPKVIRSCELCGSNETYVYYSKKGTPIYNWHYDSKNRLLCSRCHSSNYRKANRSKIQAWREKNRERINQWNKEYRIRNYERLKYQRHLKYIRNKEETLKKMKIHRELNHDKILERQGKRRAEIKSKGKK